MNGSLSKILIVDDDPISSNMLEQILAAEYNVHLALNGKDALTLAQQCLPDLILLDIVMPEMDGFEAFRQMRMIESLVNVPIIFLTSLDGESDESHGLELGAADYITKPYKSGIVRLRVKNHLELKRQLDLLLDISLTDQLTGVSNRRRFDEYLELEWKRGIRAKTILSNILIDIDYFKQFNDTYGHVAGDECLKIVAQTISETLKRPTDLMARYGGEEFGCVLPDTDAAGAFQVAETLRENVWSLKIPNKLSLTVPFITVSAGVASMVPSLDALPTTLVQEADAALYAAKADGRNKVSTLQIFDEKRL